MHSRLSKMAGICTSESRRNGIKEPFASTSSSGGVDASRSLLIREYEPSSLEIELLRDFFFPVTKALVYLRY